MEDKAQNTELPEQEAGIVTAETALAFPALILVTSFLIGMLLIAGMKSSSCVVAYEAGRALAVGENYSDTSGYEIVMGALENGKMRVSAQKNTVVGVVSCQLVLKREANGDE